MDHLLLKDISYMLTHHATNLQTPQTDFFEHLLDLHLLSNSHQI